MRAPSPPWPAARTSAESAEMLARGVAGDGQAEAGRADFPADLLLEQGFHLILHGCLLAAAAVDDGAGVFDVRPHMAAFRRRSDSAGPAGRPDGIPIPLPEERQDAGNRPPPPPGDGA